MVDSWVISLLGNPETDCAGFLSLDTQDVEREQRNISDVPEIMPEITPEIPEIFHWFMGAGLCHYTS